MTPPSAEEPRTGLRQPINDMADGFEEMVGAKETQGEEVVLESPVLSGIYDTSMDGTITMSKFVFL